jgi:hypothetical protein
MADTEGYKEAKKYREKAAEARSRSDKATDPLARRTWLLVADELDLVASLTDGRSPRPT